MKKIITTAVAAALTATTLVCHAEGGIQNGDFTAQLDGWTVTNSQNVKVENGALTLNGEKDKEIKVSQKVSGLQNGTYDLNVWTTANNVNGTCYAYAKSKGAVMSSTAVPVSTDAVKITVANVKINDGECEIGLYLNGSTNVTADNFEFIKTPSTRRQFLKGGEISKISYVEDNGGVFRYSDGTAGDGLQIMAENGFNLARIRLLDNPGKGRGGYSDDKTEEYYLPEGYLTEADCLSMARRAKDKGMQIEFTFAYSDYWVDGINQHPPKAWDAELTGTETNAQKLDFYADKVYTYTKDVMQKLAAQGTTPEYVSIGNEIQAGILFGHWKDWNDGADHSGLYYNSNSLKKLLQAGSKAVREVSPETKIIFHTDNGGEVLRRAADGVWGRDVYTDAIAGVDFDIIGVSYYPFYSNDRVKVSIDRVVDEFNEMITKYNKDVIIMETGYNWNELRGDRKEGQLKNNGYYQDIYGETEEGQKAYLTELFAKLKSGVNGGRCVGVLYWDPVMLYDGGTGKIGWAQAMSGKTLDNVVSNSNLFDFNGKALISQNAMKYNTDSSDKVLVTGKIENAQNKRINLIVNGTDYMVTADKFGQYIAAVDYPASETLEIRAVGYSPSYTVSAPADGVLVKNIDFTKSMEITKSEDQTGFTVTSKDGARLPDIMMFAAEYNENGVLTDVKIGSTTVSEDGLSAQIRIETASDRVYMLWDGQMRPLADIEELN